MRTAQTWSPKPGCVCLFEEGVMSTKIPQYASFDDNPWPPGAAEDWLQQMQPPGYVPWAERWPSRMLC